MAFLRTAFGLIEVEEGRRGSLTQAQVRKQYPGALDASHGEDTPENTREPDDKPKPGEQERQERDQSQRESPPPPQRLYRETEPFPDPDPEPEEIRRRRERDASEEIRRRRERDASEEIRRRRERDDYRASTAAEDYARQQEQMRSGGAAGGVDDRVGISPGSRSGDRGFGVEGPYFPARNEPGVTGAPILPQNQEGVPFSINPDNPLFSLSPFINQMFNASFPALQQGTFLNPDPINTQLRDFYQSSAIPQNFDNFFSQLTGQSQIPNNPFGNQLNASLMQALQGQLGGVADPSGLTQNLFDPQAAARFSPVLGGLQGAQGGLLSGDVGRGQDVGLAQRGVLGSMNRLLDPQGLGSFGLNPAAAGAASPILGGLQGAQGEILSGDAGQGVGKDLAQGGILGSMNRLLDPKGLSSFGLDPGAAAERSPILRGLQASQGELISGQPDFSADPGRGAATGGILGQINQRFADPLSSQFAGAARERILAPSQEALRGRLNTSVLGNQGSIRSGLSQELLRRNEADFNRDLLLNAQQAQQGAVSQGMGFQQQLAQQEMARTGQAFQQRLGLLGTGGALQQQLAQQEMGRTGQAFQQQLGAIGQGGQLQQQLAGQEMGRIGQGFQQGQAGSQNILQALQQGLGREQFTGGFGQQNIGLGNQFLNTQNQFNLGQQDIQAALLRTLLTGTAQTGGGGILGGLIGKGIEALPGIAAAFSSKEFKRDIRPLDSTQDTLDIVNDTKLVKFKYRWEDKDKEHIGMILEDSHPVLSTSDGTRIDIDAIGVIMGALQEQSKQIERLKLAASR